MKHVVYTQNGVMAIIGLPDDATDVQSVDGLELPSDRSFRSAWKVAGNKVAIDMAAARDIHRAHLISRGKTPDDNVLDAIAAAKTPEELKAISGA